MNYLRILLLNIFLLLVTGILGADTQVINLGTKHVGDYITCSFSTSYSISRTTWDCNSNVGEITNRTQKSCRVKLVGKGQLIVFASTSLSGGHGVETRKFVCEVLPVSPDYVSISPSDDVELNVGGTVTLDAKLHPSYSEASSYLWSVADPSIISFKDYKYHDTKITGLKAGVTTVSVLVDGKLSASRRVLVYGNNPTSISIPSTKTLSVGESSQISATFYPSDTRTQLTWSSSNPSVATISSDGTIAALSPGKTIITVETTNHVTAKMELNVEAIPISLESSEPFAGSTNVDVLVTPILTFNQSVIYRDNGEKSIHLKLGNSNVPGKTQYSGNTVKILPFKALLPNTLYQILIPKGCVTDEWGIPNAQESILSFSTGALRKLTLTASEESGSFLWKGTTVDLSASEGDAMVYYTLDGTEPSKESNLYVNPIEINRDLVLWAKAYLDGYEVAELKNVYKLSVLSRKEWFPTNGYKYTFKDHLFTYKDVNPYVEFSVDISKGEAFDEIKLLDEQGEAVEGRVYLHGKRITFVPDNPLPEGRAYRVSVPANSVKAYNGQTNSVNMGWSFQTGFSVEDFSAGFRHALLVKSNHIMNDWGYMNVNGTELWNDAANSFCSDNIVQVSAGYTHNMAVQTDGYLFAFGNQYCGEMGYGSLSDVRWPVIINLESDKVFCGGQNTAILKDGILYLAGRNDYHQIDDYDGILSDRYAAFCKVDLTDVVKVVPSLENTFMLTAKGELYGMGNSMDCVLYNKYGSFYNYVRVMSGVKDFTTCKWGTSNVAVIKDDGRLLMWGSNKYGLLGTGETVDYKSPVEIMTDVKSVSLGLDCAAAVKNDGTLWMWGSCAHGQLTDKITSDTNTPQQVMTNVERVEIGDHYVLALKDDGSLWSWGCNKYAQLGRRLDGPYQENVDVDAAKPALVMVGREAESLEGLSLRDTQIVLYVGEQAVAIGQTEPLKVNYQKWEWTVDNTDIATVDDRGVVSAKTVGSTKLTLMTDNGLSASCNIIVAEPTEIHTVESNKKIFDIYDLQGRKLKTKVNNMRGLKPGIYIVDGKKVLVR